MSKWLELLALAGPGVSAAGATLSLLQWLQSNKQRRQDLTIRDYQEWLRRRGEHEILKAIETNQQLLDGLTGLVEDIILEFNYFTYLFSV